MAEFVDFIKEVLLMVLFTIILSVCFVCIYGIVSLMSKMIRKAKKKISTPMMVPDTRNSKTINTSNDFVIHISKNGELVIPSNVSVIGFEKCAGNNRIKSVTIPGTVKMICARAFAKCENLESVILHEGIETIESHVFAECPKLRHVVYPDSVKEYDGNTFRDTCLESPVLNASGTVLVYCPPTVAGSEYTVPDTVKTIARHAFCEYDKLKVLHLPEGLETLDKMAVTDCGILELTIPYSVTEIKEASLYKCKELKKVTILNPDTRFSFAPFINCDKLTEINCGCMVENDKYFHVRGMCFLQPNQEDTANFNHKAILRFKQLAQRCANGDVNAMQELSEFFELWSEKPNASPFYRRTANYWRYKAYCKGNIEAVKWFRIFFAEHPGEYLESTLPEDNVPAYFSTPGFFLNDIGFQFFKKDKFYIVQYADDYGLVIAGTYHSWESPDEDGFGAEDDYEWWFMDENMNPIPGIKSLIATVGEMNREWGFCADEKAKAIEVLKQKFLGIE